MGGVGAELDREPDEGFLSSTLWVPVKAMPGNAVIYDRPAVVVPIPEHSIHY